MIKDGDLKKFSGIINAHPPKVNPITEETIQVTKSENVRFRGSVRVATGNFWTDDGYATWKKNLMDRKLP